MESEEKKRDRKYHGIAPPRKSCGCVFMNFPNGRVLCLIEFKILRGLPCREKIIL
jgi:hypothetical protein